METTHTTENAPGASTLVDACSLDPEELPVRLGAWAATVAAARRRTPITDGVRLEYAPRPGVAAELAELAEAEQSCCSFFHFAVTISSSATALEVTAPDGARVAELLARA